jgi:hypothetical protein
MDGEREKMNTVYMNGQTDRRTIEKMYIAQDRAGVMKELR